MKKNKWLAISIFSAKRNWPFLLKNGVHPLIDQLTNNNEIISFNLQFNDTNSEHIRLALLAPGDLAYKVAKKADICFKELFKENELSLASRSDSLNQLFVPYLKHKLHYDLYSTTILPVSGVLLTLQQGLSWSMLEAFSDGAFIDNDLILTFCLHILFSCYKVIPESERVLYVKEYLSRHDIGYYFFYFKYNATAIGEIYNDVMNPLAENPAIWLNKWEEAFKRMYAVASDNSQQLIYFNQAVNFIQLQLRLSAFSMVFLNFCILKTLSA